MNPSALYRGFRESYLPHDTLTAQLRAWAEAFPDVVRLRPLCTTPGGREQWLLIVGRDPDRTRPAAWVDGNMHASELCGSSVALQIAEDAITAAIGGDDALTYVLPRLSPDGAEAVLTTGAYVRSAPRTRPKHGGPWWRCRDIDGDGLSLLLRKPDPCGEFVESTEIPGLMLLRAVDDPGPFYKVWPEGVIEGFDGHHVPDPSFLSDNDVDLNRQFPYLWRADHVQIGAGPFPASEPEAEAVVRFASAHPEIFFWLNLHTFGGVFIRPLGDEPDRKMDRADLALYRQVEAWADELVGYPTVSGFEEFLYSPDTPVFGDLVDYAYRMRGAIGLTCELWDLFAQAGIARKKPFIDTYTQLDRADMLAIARFDRDHNHGRAVRPWRRVDHPQLGPVEVGGLDPRVGISNPPVERLGDVCRRVSSLFHRVAATRPRLSAHVQRDGAVARITVENTGYLPTNVLSSAKALHHGTPVWLEASGATGERRVEIGHLDGWGRGRFDGTDAIYYMRSRGTGHRRVVELALRDTGPVRVRVGCPRTGWIEADG